MMFKTLEDYHRRTGATHWASSHSALPILLDVKLRMKEGDVCVLSKAHAITAYKLVFEMLPEKPPTAGPFCSLGMALPFALGVAMARPNNTVYVVVGDGSLQEGSNLEALAAAVRLDIKNIKVIVDNNGMQAMQDTPPLQLLDMEWIATHKGDDWRCHYRGPE